MTDLAAHIQRTPLVDTHEHLNPEEAYVNEGPDVLHDLFSIYIADDLHSAGASYEDVLRLFDSTDPDVSGRWHGVEKAWQRCRHTGYGEAVQNVARIVYGMPEISLKEIEAASETNRRLRQPGQRLRLLRDLANIDHVQIDDLEWGCRHEPADAEFFLHDMSWVTFCRGEIDFVALHSESGIEVTDLKSLRAAFAALFELHAPVAIAIKAQLPYYRTLEWNERADADAAPVLQKRLQGKPLTEEEQNCLGDWCWARGVELAVDHHLPFKLHTGYLAGCDQNIHHRRIRPGAIIPLVQRYPLARFVLMHIGYPYSDEVIAIAKHYRNVVVDMCWSWSINPFHASDFLRRFIHAVPISKLFGFGGDSFWPAMTVGYAHQTRRWMTRAMEDEVDEGCLTEEAAMDVAGRIMRDNQLEYFDLPGTRAAIRSRQLDGVPVSS